MNIRKIGHCCLQIDVGETRILTDPGIFSDGQNSIEHINAVIITHEHADHCHIPSLQQIMLNNPGVKIYANKATSRLLEQEGIEYSIISHADVLDINGITVTCWNTEHAEIYEQIDPVLNTALLINETLLYPGDAFFVPQGTAVDTLALPVAGPWCKTSEVIDYALQVKPRQCFPVHDAVLHGEHGEPFHRVAATFISKEGIIYHNLNEGETLEIS